MYANIPCMHPMGMNPIKPSHGRKSPALLLRMRLLCLLNSFQSVGETISDFKSPPTWTCPPQPPYMHRVFFAAMQPLLSASCLRLHSKPGIHDPPHQAMRNKRRSSLEYCDEPSPHFFIESSSNPALTAILELLGLFEFTFTFSAEGPFSAQMLSSSGGKVDKMKGKGKVQFFLYLSSYQKSTLEFGTFLHSLLFVLDPVPPPSAPPWLLGTLWAQDTTAALRCPLRLAPTNAHDLASTNQLGRSQADSYFAEAYHQISCFYSWIQDSIFDLLEEFTTTQRLLLSNHWSALSCTLILVSAPQVPPWLL